MRTILALFACAASILAADQTVFRGTPTVRVFSDAVKEQREQLDGDAAEKAECVIVQRGQKFYWASRQNELLTRVDIEPFSYFMHKDGAGYIKILKVTQKDLGSAGDYVEHINRGLETITYWGKSHF